MSKTNYRGKGILPCPKCQGSGKIKCNNCSGHGKLSTCNNCNSTGKANCSKCDGSGKDVSICPVCDKGRVSKTRWINCEKCHGTGQVRTGNTWCNDCGHISIEDSHPAGSLCDFWNGSADRRCHGTYQAEMASCSRCNGRGQVKEVYYEICPNCHGEYKRTTDKSCKNCEGTGKVKCDRCDGTGHAKCKTCEGSGTVKCEKCNGEGILFDSTMSLKSMQDAASDGNLFALHELAYAYILGTDGLSVSYDKAKECFEKILKHEVGNGEEDNDEWWSEYGVGSAEVYLKFLPGLCNGDTNSMRELAKTFSEWDGAVKIEGCDPSDFWEKKASEVESKHKERERNRKMRERIEDERKEIEGAKQLGIPKSRSKCTGGGTAVSSKKRWKFVVLGLLLGFFGIHLAYAKRWVLFLLLWAGFITGNVMSDPKKEPTNVSTEVVTEQVQSESKSDKESSNPISNIGFAVWGLLWIGGTLFIKKDGKGNRM